MERKISMNYIEPEWEIIVFQTDDVICTSGSINDPIELPDDDFDNLIE